MKRSGASKRLEQDLDNQGWDAEGLGSSLEEASRVMKLTSRDWAAIRSLDRRLAQLYTLVEGLVAEETNERAAAARIQIAFAAQESDFVEFKSSLRYNMATKQVDKAMEFEVVRAIAGLANHQGGDLFIGVDDSGQILGVERDLSTFSGRNHDDQFRRHFDQLIDHYFGVANYQIVQAEWTELEDKRVFVIHIKKAMAPLFVRRDEDGEFYVRRGARTLELRAQRFLEYHKLRWPGGSSEVAAS